MHSAVNYYGYHQGLDFLVSEGINKSEIVSLLTQEKFDTRWQEMMNPSDFTQMIQSYIGKAVGASGAVYGLLVAFAFMFPNAELALMFIPVPIKAKYFVPIWIVGFDICYGIIGGYLGLTNSGFGHFAHLGGALCGFLMMWYWKKNQFDKNRWD